MLGLTFCATHSNSGKFIFPKLLGYFESVSNFGIVVKHYAAASSDTIFEVKNTSYSLLLIDEAQKREKVVKIFVILIIKIKKDFY